MTQTEDVLSAHNKCTRSHLPAVGVLMYYDFDHSLLYLSYDLFSWLQAV